MSESKEFNVNVTSMCPPIKGGLYWGGSLSETVISMALKDLTYGRTFAFHCAWQQESSDVDLAGLELHAEANVTSKKRKQDDSIFSAAISFKGTNKDSLTRLYTGDGVIAIISVDEESTGIVVLAETRELRDKLVSQLRIYPEPEPGIEDTGKLPVGMWSGNGSYSLKRSVRKVRFERWADISRNYPAEVKAVLAELARLTAKDIDGRVALFYGPAGTGKTTFLRALAYEWREWATLELISNPECLLDADTSYMDKVLEGSSEESSSPFRLLVIEDAGELMRKTSSGQSLSRLLNVADGLLGDSSNVIIVITTNEDISELHPAVIRPGRCLVKAEIGKLSLDEAQAWIGDGFKVAEPMTLAELYHVKKGLGKAARGTVEQDKYESGQYL